MAHERRFGKLSPDLAQIAPELEKLVFPDRGIIGVYHTLLMQDALSHLEVGGTPSEFVEKYSIVLGSERDDCRFHADLKVFEKEGLYLPRKKSRLDGFNDGVGHFFNSDHSHAFTAHLCNYFRSGPTDRNREILYRMRDLWEAPWLLEDFSNPDKLRQGLEFGQLAWVGSLYAYRNLEPKRGEHEIHLVESLISYYEEQIGPIEVNWDTPEF